MGVQKYTAAERRKDIGAAVLGAVLLGGILYMVSDSKEEREAAAFPDLWELMSPNALTEALRNGAVRQADVQYVISSGRAVHIRTAIALLVNAPGILDDSERAVLGAVMRPTYPELLLFNSMFNAQEQMSPGAFILGFMNADSDEASFAAIVRYVLDLRATYAAG